LAFASSPAWTRLPPLAQFAPIGSVVIERSETAPSTPGAEQT
jgi:hypothetical protein